MATWSKHFPTFIRFTSRACGTLNTICFHVVIIFKYLIIKKFKLILSIIIISSICIIIVKIYNYRINKYIYIQSIKIEMANRHREKASVCFFYAPTIRSWPIWSRIEDALTREEVASRYEAIFKKWGFWHLARAKAIEDKVDLDPEVENAIDEVARSKEYSEKIKIIKHRKALESLDPLIK